MAENRDSKHLPSRRAVIGAAAGAVGASALTAWPAFGGQVRSAEGSVITTSTSLGYGDLNADRFPPNGWKGFEWIDPGGWTTVDVTTEGLPGDDESKDAAKEVLAILDRHPGQRIRLYFPAGTYHFYSDLRIVRSDLIIFGDGPSRTNFVIDTPAGEQTAIGIIGGGYAADEVDVVSSVSRGDDTLTVADASGIDVGDLINLYDFFLHRGLVERINQLVEVTAKDGNVLSVDMTSGLDMADPKVRKMDPAHNVGFSDLHVERLNQAPNNTRNLRMSFTRNAFFRNLDVANVVTGGIYAGRCRDVVIEGNKVHDSQPPIRGGRGDGIMVHGGSTNVYVTNNTAHNLRHHIWVGSANHCVIAFNETLPEYQAYGDISQHNGHFGHNNLYEGNSGNEILTDRFVFGPTWYITFYRNSVTAKVGSELDQTEFDNILANEIGSADGMNDAGSDSYVGANIVAGEVEWGEISPDETVPPSLYLAERPAGVVRWPLYGVVSSAQVIAALDDYVAAGLVQGNGSGSSADARLHAFRNMLVNAHDLIRSGADEAAVDQLTDAQKRVHVSGDLHPSHLVTGSAAPALWELMERLKEQL